MLKDVVYELHIWPPPNIPNEPALGLDPQYQTGGDCTHRCGEGNKSVRWGGAVVRPGGSVASVSGQPPDDRTEGAADNEPARAADHGEHPDQDELRQDRAGERAVELDRGITIQEQDEPAGGAEKADRKKKPANCAENPLKIRHADPPVAALLDRDETVRKPDRLQIAQTGRGPSKVS